MTETTPPEGPSQADVDEARDALKRPHDGEDADGTTRGAENEPEVPEEG